MKIYAVSDHRFAVINEKNRMCDANSGLINCGGRIELFGKVWSGVPQRVINTHEDVDHTTIPIL